MSARSQKTRTLNKAREKSLAYLTLRSELEEARGEMVNAIYEASENGNAQEELARECSFPEIGEDMVFSRSRIQQFIREVRKTKPKKK